MRSVGLGLRRMLDDIDRASIPQTPRRTGDLRSRKLKQVLGFKASIAWLTDYAIYQELKQFGHYTTAGTGPHFAKNAVLKVTAKARDYFRRAGA